MKRIYFDNGSTSFPKAPGVSQAVKDLLDNGAFNINRGGYEEAYAISEQVLEAREMLCRMFDFKKPRNVVFTPSITYSLNYLIKGFLKRGDHVITSSMEHNAVIRPLVQMEELGIECVSVPVPGALRTNIKVMDDTTGIITEINAKGVKVDEDAVQRMEDAIVDCAMDSSWVALTGSMPPGCGADCYANLIRRIHSEAPSCLVALDADGEAFRLGVKENPDFIKPNRAELSTFVGEKLDTDEKLQAAARKLVEDGLGCVIVSMDSEGSMLFSEGLELTAKAVKVPVVTTVGAGDNLVSGYLSGREAGLSHAEAFRRGVATATARVAGEDGQYDKYIDQVTVTAK